VTRRVRVSADAEAQLRAIRTWWVANRPATFDLFDREVDAAIAAIGSSPATFPIYHHEAGADVRRIILPKTRYAMYFAEEAGVVLIVAVWHGARGRGPPLP
jgi:plasmid stabilization system protein ParE